jgi:hypothetical protein
MLDQPRYSKPGTTAFGATEKPQLGLLPFLNVLGPTAGSFTAWNSNARHAGEEIAQGWLKFVSDRFNKDLALPQQLAACKTVNDVYLLYSEFWQQVAKDYAAEFTAVADRVMSVVEAPLDAAACSANQKTR